MSSSPPSQILVFHIFSSTLLIHTKIVECILQFIDEIYQVLVHCNALDRYSNRERSSTSMVGVVRVRKPCSIRQLYLFLLFSDVLALWRVGSDRTVVLAPPPYSTALYFKSPSFPNHPSLNDTLDFSELTDGNEQGE